MRSWPSQLPQGQQLSLTSVHLLCRVVLRCVVAPPTSDNVPNPRRHFPPTLSIRRAPRRARTDARALPPAAQSLGARGYIVVPRRDVQFQHYVFSADVVRDGGCHEYGGSWCVLIS